MGTTSSTPANDPHHEDLNYLADRFPFGDAELHRLYEAYLQIIQQQPRSTFLQDWAVQTTLQKHKRGWKKRHLNKEEDGEEARLQRESQAEERRTLLQVVEEQILMSQAGNSLYQAACLAPGDEPLYTTTPPKEASVAGTGSNAEAVSSSPPLVDEYTRKARLEQMFTGFTRMGRKGAKDATEILFDVIAAHHSYDRQDDSEPVRIHALSLVKLAYTLALSTSFLEAAACDDDEGMASFTSPDKNSEKALQAMALSMVSKAESRLQRDSIIYTDNAAPVDKERAKKAFQAGYIEWGDLMEWVEDVGPLMASILPSFVQVLLFPDQPAPPSRTAYKFPRLTHPSVFFDTPTSSLLFKLGCLTASLSGTYYRLYTSASDGLSFNRLIHALLGYGGPTLLVIQSTDGAVFGAYTGAPWKESKDFYGTSDSFLYQLSPVTAVYRPKASGQANFMYCNSHARSKGYDQQAHGIGFGGTLDQPRLFLAETFDYNDNFAGTQDVAYENGPFLPATESGTYPKHFEVEALEVWGVGGDEVVEQALGAQSKIRSIRDEGIRRAKKVDRAAFLDDLRSGVIDSKAFAHRQQIDGRADADLEDRYQEKYDYEK
eukprot:scaffold39887_cov229-Amphora_coffeaeformis.AAC.7